MYFFHKMLGKVPGSSWVPSQGEKYSETCQWTVPPIWAGDPLADGSALSADDFIEPVDTWLPTDDAPGESVQTEQTDNQSLQERHQPTAGVMARPARRARKGVKVGPEGGIEAIQELNRNKDQHEDQNSSKSVDEITFSSSLPDGFSNQTVVAASPSDGVQTQENGREVALLRRLAGSSDDLLALLASKLGIEISKSSAVGEEQKTVRRTTAPTISPLRSDISLISAVTEPPTTKPPINVSALANTGISIPSSPHTINTPAAPRAVSEIGGPGGMTKEEEFADMVDSDDDLWSDDENEAGDVIGNPLDKVGPLPGMYGWNCC
jgi:hypothetical protein